MRLTGWVTGGILAAVSVGSMTTRPVQGSADALPAVLHELTALVAAIGGLLLAWDQFRHHCRQRRRRRKD